MGSKAEQDGHIVRIGDKVIVQFKDGFDPVKGYWLEQTPGNVRIRSERGGEMNGPFIWVKKI